MLFPVENSSIVGATSRAAQRICSTPAFECIPPEQAQPLIQASFGPLSMGPPARAKLGCVSSCGNREKSSAKFVPEDAQRSASVEVRGHDQHPPALLVRETSFDVVRFVPSRESFDRADA